MTVETEKLFCTRCGGYHRCIVLESMAFCSACFDIMANDRETAVIFTKLCDKVGIVSFEN